jgi:zinc finger SWIM domain-containing protein 3
VNYQAARKAKHAILKRSSTDRIKQYQQLPDYLRRLAESNPGTTYHLLKDPKTFRFQRVFICPVTSHIALRYIRGLVAVDGTFLKGSFTQTLLLAVAMDAENQILVLGWALAEAETESCCRWFLRQLKEAMPDFDDDETTLISDRDKGLMSADTELEYAKRAYCTQHIAANVQAKFGSEVRRLFVAVTYTRTEAKFNSAMEQLREASENAHVYVSSIDKTLWAAPFMTARRWGQMTSNIVESINAIHKEDRCLSCIDLLDAIWNRCMDVSFTRHQDSLQQMSVQGAKFTKFGLGLLEESINFSQQRHVYVSSSASGLITTLQDKKYVVDLVKKSCACGRFQENCVPCGHAVALIRKLKHQPREYMPAVFSLENYEKTYARNINPVNTADLSVSTDCYAPHLKRPRGRPKER